MERRQSNVAAATNAADAGEIAIRKTRDYEVCVRIAASLPDYFTPAGVEMVRADVPRGDLYGAFVADQLVGFALYKVLNAEAVELAWLAVDRRHWSRGVGTRLVTTSLAALPAQYRACQVKTLAATAADAGYARTRRLYAE